MGGGCIRPRYAGVIALTPSAHRRAWHFLRTVQRSVTEFAGETTQRAPAPPGRGQLLAPSQQNGPRRRTRGPPERNATAPPAGPGCPPVTMRPRTRPSTTTRYVVGLCPAMRVLKARPGAIVRPPPWTFTACG